MRAGTPLRERETVAPRGAGVQRGAGSPGKSLRYGCRPAGARGAGGDLDGTCPGLEGTAAAGKVLARRRPPAWDGALRALTAGRSALDSAGTRRVPVRKQPRRDAPPCAAVPEGGSDPVHGRHRDARYRFLRSPSAAGPNSVSGRGPLAAARDTCAPLGMMALLA